MKDTRFCTTHGPCAIYNVNAEVKNTTERNNSLWARVKLIQSVPVGHPTACWLQFEQKTNVSLLFIVGWGSKFLKG